MNLHLLWRYVFPETLPCKSLFGACRMARLTEEHRVRAPYIDWALFRQALVVCLRDTEYAQNIVIKSRNVRVAHFGATRVHKVLALDEDNEELCEYSVTMRHRMLYDLDETDHEALVFRLQPCTNDDKSVSFTLLFYS